MGANIVAYSTTGEPLTVKEYVAEIDEARQQVIDGKSISRDQLLGEIDAW